jgi:hypothetical protein
MAIQECKELSGGKRLPADQLWADGRFLPYARNLADRRQVPGSISVTFSNDIPISFQFTYNQYTILDLFGGLKYFSTFDSVFNQTDLINQSFINEKGEFVNKTEILKFKLKN